MRKSTVLLLLGCAALIVAQPCQGQGLELLVHMDKNRYFEDEPIYVVIELRNLTADTAWLASPFETATRDVEVVIESNEGFDLRDTGVRASHYFGPEWPGVPVPPATSIFEVTVLQRQWGAGDPTPRRLPPRRLPIGSYRMSAAYVGDVDLGRIEAAEVQFSIRARTQVEAERYARVQRVAAIAWNNQERRQYLPQLLATTVDMLRSDSSDVFVPYLLHDGVSLAKAVGHDPQGPDLPRLRALQLAFARAQPGKAAAAFIIAAYYAAHESPAADVIEVGGQLAGRVARDIRSRARETRR